MNVLSRIQDIGRSLMLPIAVLPVAAILLRIGALSGDFANAGWMQLEFFKILLQVFLKAGDSVFSHLPLIFSLGVAIGIAKDNHGASALAALVGYLIFDATLNEFHLVDLGEGKLDAGVLGGIVIGLMAGWLYNRFHNTVLPQWLAFFGGRRLVPILSGFGGLIVAFVFAIIWPYIQIALGHVGMWLIANGGLGGAIYGVLNRLLLVFGLHHILNTLVWFQFGDFTKATGELVHGDLNRFFAHDPTAGAFMTGFFPVMMFGLPAAALAMYLTAKPENRANVGGLLLSLALTAFLTGITEPIEYSFMFLAPVLYGVHAVLTGLSMWITTALGMKLGFGFSAGAFDYVINFPLSTKPGLLFIVGPIYFVLYFVLFYFGIKMFNIKTPGRADVVETKPNGIDITPSGGDEIRSAAQAYLSGVGGFENIESLTSCISRVRLVLKDRSKVDEAAIKAHPMTKGAIKVGDQGYQIIAGTQAELIMDAMKAMKK